MPRLPTLGVGILVGLLGVQLAGCTVTPEKIARWKDTERGPGKLRDALKESSLAPALRAQALAALVEIGMAQDALGDLHGAAPAERQEVVHEAVPLVAKLAAAPAGTETTRVEREAKDALFELRADAAPADLPAIDDALIAWTTADLAGRLEQGGQSSDKILTTIGARAVPRLLELLASAGGGHEGASQLEAAAILGKVADAPSRARAADALVASARQAATRTREVGDGLLKAIAAIGGSHANAFLLDQGEHGPEAVRARALEALAQAAPAGTLAADPTVLASALRLAGDRKADPKARDAAFELAEKVGPSAVPGLINLMSASEELVRWRAVEAALAAGQAAAVRPVLEALSTSRSYSKDDLDSYVVHDLSLIGQGAVPALKAELGSRSWVARVAAMRALALVGKAADASALTPLVKDGTKLKGPWGGATVGSEARAASQALQAKR